MTRYHTLMAGIAAVFILLPTVVYPVVLMKMLCFALFACAFNLLLGYAGMLSFGHAAFLGSAAYVTGHAVKVWDTGPGLGILIGCCAAAALGYVVGSLAIRRAGIYFAMITLALAQMIFFLAVQLPFTGGEDGLQGVPRGRLLGVNLGNNLAMYYVVLAACVTGIWLIRRIVHSPFGHVLRAIRDNETRAISLGYDTKKFKLLAFVLSAALAGLAGSLKVLVFQLASLTDVHWHMSGEVVLMTLLGGVGTILGPAVGATMIVGLESYAASLGDWVTILMGATFVVCVLAFREGVVGEAIGWWERMLQRRSARSTLRGAVPPVRPSLGETQER